jgi:Fe-S cluster assembly ATP-binding protein
MVLELKNLRAGIDGKEIVKGVSLTVKPGEVHAIMGPNGSGKSTLSYAIAGHPRYKVIGGKAQIDGKDILSMAPDVRAKHGLFLAFQYPSSVPGVTVRDFLRTAYNAVHKEKPLSVPEFAALLKQKMSALGMDESFASRYLNDGFSGGEKKRCEILQLAVLQPKYAILDETDSGLDIDALKVVAEGVNSLGRVDMGVLIITHYQRILRYIKPGFVHVMIEGKIVASGGEELSHKLEEKGYDWLKGGVADGKRKEA